MGEGPGSAGRGWDAPSGLDAYSREAGLDWNPSGARGLNAWLGAGWNRRGSGPDVLLTGEEQGIVGPGTVVVLLALITKDFLDEFGHLQIGRVDGLGLVADEHQERIAAAYIVRHLVGSHHATLNWDVAAQQYGRLALGGA